jgi:hypothetical protein
MSLTNADTSRTAATDSPWFWVLVFSVVGLIALASISGQYGKRQSRLERQYQARDRVVDPKFSEAERRDFSMPHATLVPIWPLAATLGAMALVAAFMLGREHRRQLRELPG